MANVDPGVISLIVVGAALVLFITEALPIAATSVLACLALAIFRVVPFGDAFAGFASDTVFLMVGMMVVGAALFETGVAGLIGQRLVKVAGTSALRFTVVVIIVAAVLSGFLNNTATMAMLIPIMAAAIGASNGALTKKGTYLAAGIAATVGGLLTLVGSPPQLIAQGLLLDSGYTPMGFFEIAVFGVPLTLLAVAYFATIGRSLQARLFSSSNDDDGAGENPANAKIAGRARNDVNSQGRIDSWVVEAGSQSRGLETTTAQISGQARKKFGDDGATRADVMRRWVVVAVLAACLLGFVLEIWTVGIVAMAGAVVCVGAGCVSQERVFESIDWTTVVIMACSYGISAGLVVSGGGELVAHSVVQLIGPGITPWLLVAAFAVIAVVLSNFMSNTGAAALLIPICMSAAAGLGYNVTAVAMTIAAAAAIGLSTPVATPPLTMALSAGYRFSDYIRIGGLFNILALATVLAIAALIL